MRLLLGHLFLVTSGIILSFPSAQAQSFNIKNFDELASQAGFNYRQIKEAPQSKRVKIAILDKDFTGYKDAIGKTLPARTTYIPGPVAVGSKGSDQHGFYMAQIAHAFITEQNRLTNTEIEFLLIEYNGYSNLIAAVDRAIQEKVDIVLHALVIEYGSNFDGGGFFNKEIDRAAHAGILWVNAAGNNKITTYNFSPIRTNADNWVQLPGPNQTISFRCDPIPDTDSCPLRLVLAWNDSKDNPEEGTDKDLDLLLLDDTLNIMAGSYLQQKLKTDGVPGESKYPREIIEQKLEKGRYLIRVKNRSNNFTNRDNLRITAVGDGIQFENSDKNENIAVMADNPRALTVGAWDADKSSLSKRLRKPEVLAPSIIELEDDKKFAGSSNATAIAVAALALIYQELDYNKKLTKEDAIKRLTSSAPRRMANMGFGLPTEALGFGPRNGECFLPLNPYNLPYNYQLYVRNGAIAVDTTQGLKLMTLFSLQNMDRRLNPRDQSFKVIATPNGLVNVARAMQNLPYPEIFELPEDSYVCSNINVNYPPTNKANTLGFKFRSGPK
jgi:hypothetical protein